MRNEVTRLRVLPAAAGLLAAALSCVGCADRPAVPVARAPLVPDSGTVAVRCGRLLDGVSDAYVLDALVIVRQGRIAEVGTGLDLPDGMALLDLTSQTCLPGLIDMHTHITDQTGDTADLKVYFDLSDAKQLEISRGNAEVTLLAGFTTIRNVGTYIAGADGRIRDEIDSGHVVGPRIQAAGFYLTVPGGGGDLLIPDVPENEIPARVRQGVARGADAFRDRARKALEEGADLLKVIASGAVLAYGGIPGAPEMTEEEIRAVVEVAHAAGKKVAAHAHGAQSIRDAIAAGADTIEHASLIDDEGIAMARRRGVALSMDIYNGDYIDTQGREQGWPEEFLVKNRELMEVQRQNFAKAYAAGVPMVFGTDSAVYPHGDNPKQFAVMVRYGMKPIDAIRSATSTAASYMGWEGDVGSLTPGHFGDLIAVAGDPLADITVLEHVDVVIKGGLVFKLPDAPR